MHQTALGWSMCSSCVHTHTPTENWLFGQSNIPRSIHPSRFCARMCLHTSVKIKSRVIDHHKHLPLHCNGRTVGVCRWGQCRRSRTSTRANLQRKHNKLRRLSNVCYWWDAWLYLLTRWTDYHTLMNYWHDSEHSLRSRCSLLGEETWILFHGLPRLYSPMFPI